MILILTNQSCPCFQKEHRLLLWDLGCFLPRKGSEEASLWSESSPCGLPVQGKGVLMVWLMTPSFSVYKTNQAEFSARTSCPVPIPTLQRCRRTGKRSKGELRKQSHCDTGFTMLGQRSKDSLLWRTWGCDPTSSDTLWLWQTATHPASLAEKGIARYKGWKPKEFHFEITSCFVLL